MPRCQQEAYESIIRIARELANARKPAIYMSKTPVVAINLDKVLAAYPVEDGRVVVDVEGMSTPSFVLEVSFEEFVKAWQSAR